jgi:hypothetical protein
MGAPISRRTDADVGFLSQNRQMAQHDRVVMTMRFVDLSATFMTSGDVDRAPHSDDNIIFFI